jgi:hypothetical protein
LRAIRENIEYIRFGQRVLGRDSMRRRSRTAQAMRLAPDQCAPYEVLRTACLALQRFDEVRQIITRRRRENWMIHTHIMLFMLWPFSARTPRRWRNSNSGLRASPKRTLDWLSHPTPRPMAVIWQGAGLTKRAVESAIQADSKETGAIWQANAALRTSGLRQRCRSAAVSGRGFEACSRESGRRSEAALAFAMAGDTARAESLAQDLGKRFPLDTQMQSLWLPAIQAQLALVTERTRLPP